MQSSHTPTTYLYLFLKLKYNKEYMSPRIKSSILRSQLEDPVVCELQDKVSVVQLPL